jgi:glycosyltransferase involved in cell wall biosynthesis
VVEDNDGRGPAAVRNIGWRRATGELICFVDDDVVLDGGWARAFLDAHRENPDAVLQGCTEPHPAEAAAQDAFSRSKAITQLDWNYQTCNIAYPRALLERLGGFDEAYRFASAEDTDLGWRAREAGAPIRFVHDAHAWHAVQRPGVLGLVRRMRIKTDVARLTRRHPGIRHHYYREIFCHSRPRGSRWRRAPGARRSCLRRRTCTSTATATARTRGRSPRYPATQRSTAPKSHR